MREEKISIEAIKEPQLKRCLGCDFYHKCNGIYNLFVKKGYPDCNDGYIYKIREDNHN